MTQVNMSCMEYRQRCGAEPDCQLPEFVRHEQQCAACSSHAREMRQFDARILKALLIDMPQRGAAPGPITRTLRTHWMGLAASVLVAAGLAAGAWLSWPQPALASAVLSHLEHESDAWDPVETPVAREVLDAVLERGKVALEPGAGLITYARSCPIRGHRVPHLMLQGQKGPIMLLILADEPLQAPIPLARPGYTGVILPVGSGSIALVGREGEPVRETADRISRSVDMGGI